MRRADDGGTHDGLAGFVRTAVAGSIYSNSSSSFLAELPFEVSRRSPQNMPADPRSRRLSLQAQRGSAATSGWSMADSRFTFTGPKSEDLKNSALMVRYVSGAPGRPSSITMAS